MTDPDDIGPGYVPPPGTPLVTQADRWSWQRKAGRALGDILDAHPDLPQIVWTVGPTGGLTGQVGGLAPAEEVSATFAAWQRPLGLESLREAPIRDTGVTALSGQAYHGIVAPGWRSGGAVRVAWSPTSAHRHRGAGQGPAPGQQ